LLRVEALRVEDMIKKSFSENDSQKSKGNVQQSLKESEEALKNAEKLDCSICNQDISEFYSLNVRLISMSSSIHSYFINQPKNKVLTPGRIIIINNEFWRNCPAVYLRFIDQGRERKIECIPLAYQQQTSNLTNDALPFFHWPLNNGKRDFRDSSLIQIEVEHVISVINFSVKIPFSILGIPSKGEIKSVAEHAFNLIQSSFAHANPAQLEIDYEANCKDLDIISMLRNRKTLVQQYFTYTCLICKQHSSHYAKYHIQRSLGEKLAEIQHMLTDNSLFLLPEYNQRIEVLKKLSFIDEEQNVLLKGRVACEFNTIDELIATELIFENMFNDFDGAEIIALLSCFVFQEKSSSGAQPNKRVDLNKPIKTQEYAHLASPEKDSDNLPGNLQKGKDLIIEVATRLALLQKEAGISSVSVENTLESLKWGMLPVVYEWANGLSFKAITQMTDIAEGSIVRCIVRLDETAREVRNASRTIGDGQLLKKMEGASAAIKRDICFASSLYL
jgi:antiviral helicase SKI2